eukprot:Rmarinus@m.15301
MSSTRIPRHGHRMSAEIIEMENIVLESSVSRRERELLNKQQTDSAAFIRKNFRMKLCESFFGGETDQTCKACRRTRELHSAADVEVGEKWSSPTHTQLLPTNAFGEIFFPGRGATGKPAPFVRVADVTDPSLLKTLCIDLWKLPSPQLVISVTGGALDFDVDPNLRQEFMTGIMKTATTTDAWVITGGSDAGVMKYVGEARAQFGHQVPLIGIITWGVVFHRQDLESEKRNYETHQYVADGPRGMQAGLDPFHSHFIMVDDGSEFAFGKEIRLRAEFEAAVAGTGGSAMKGIVDREVTQNDKVPTVCLVLNGGPGTIETVYQSIKQNTPVVTLVESGKCAQFVALAWRHMHAAERTCPVCEEILSCTECMDSFVDPDKRRFECIPCHKHHLCPAIEAAGVIAFGKQQSDDVTRKIIFTVAQKSKVVVYETGHGKPDLDTCILRAILHGGGFDFSDQLVLCMRWKRPEIARSEILTQYNMKKQGVDGQKYRDELRQALVAALLRNSPSFTRLLIENGAEIDLDVDLADLYIQTVADRDKSKEYLCSLYRGSRVHALVRKLYQSVIPKRVIRELSPGQGLLNRSGRSESAGTGVSMDSLGGDVEGVKHPYYYLMMWAAIFYREDLARYFWEIAPEPLSASISAACVLHGLESYVSREEQDDVRAYAVGFEQLAVDMIGYCFEEDNNLALKSIEMVTDVDSSKALVDLAFAGGCDDIVKTMCCQLAIRKRWADPLSYSTPVPVLLAGLVMPPLIPIISEQFSSTNSAEEEFPLRRTKSQRSVVSNRLLEGRSFALRAYANYYHAPGTKFLANNLLYIVFVVLWAGVTLSSFPDHLQGTEVGLLVWVVALIIEEAIQCYGHGLYYWWSDEWNKLDFSIYLLYTLSFVLRIAELSSSEWDDRRLDVVPLPKRVMSVGVILCCTRLLSMFTVHPVVGPLLVTIRKMMTDVLAFLVIFIVYNVGFGVCFQSLMDPWNWTNESLKGLIGNVLERPYWLAYGDLAILDLSTMNLFRWMVAFYLVISNVVLMNLLIAMMGSTYSTVGARSRVVWLYSFYETTEEYTLLPAVPAPFTIFYRVLEAFFILFGDRQELSRSQNAETESTLHRWLERLRAMYMKEEQERSRLSSETKLSRTMELGGETSSRVESISARLSKLEGKMGRIDEKMDALVAALKPATAPAVASVE